MIKFLKSFIHAGRGVALTTRGRNFRVQFLCSVLAIIFSFVLKISTTEWLIVLILIGTVLAAETFNTSIEELANVVKQQNELDYTVTKEVRDLAAGAVLIVSVFSAIIGLIIFLPKIF